MSKFSKHLERINAIVRASNGTGILEVIIDGEDGKESIYFSVESFEKPSVSSISSNPFFQVIGYDITVLIFEQITMAPDAIATKIADLRRFSKLRVDVNFSYDHQWRLYN